ncbi:MAG TPA: DUF3616 domain-containing protein [Thermoanaerobaculia bacterium]
MERDVVIDCPMNEASGLLAIQNRSILRSHGWSVAFWTCSDEARVEEALGVIGRRGSGEWEVCRLDNVRATPGRKTEDCEGMARRDPYVYIFGSQYGAKDGPLEARRQFVARFNESAIRGKVDEAKISLEIARGRFKIHRLINDALRDSGLDLIERGKREAKNIRKTRKRGKRKKKDWVSRVAKDDWPIDLEGVSFTPRGTLLLGLRYPVTRDGHPVFVEIDDVDSLFQDPPGDPKVLHVWVLENVGSPGRPRGVRALEELRGELHVITGSLDSAPEESQLIEDHSEGEKAESRHHRFRLPRDGGIALRAERVQVLEDETKVEGLSIDGDGRFWYALDDEKVRLRCEAPR